MPPTCWLQKRHGLLMHCASDSLLCLPLALAVWVTPPWSIIFGFRLAGPSPLPMGTVACFCRSQPACPRTVRPLRDTVPSMPHRLSFLLDARCCCRHACRRVLLHLRCPAPSLAMCRMGGRQQCFLRLVLGVLPLHRDPLSPAHEVTHQILWPAPRDRPGSEPEAWRC